MPSSALTVQDKNYLIQCFCLHYTVYAQKAELDQIRDGFKILEFDGLVRETGSMLRPLFLCSGRPKVTAQGLLELFEVNFSLQGSNRRSREEEVVLNWNYYVSDLEGMQDVPPPPYMVASLLA